MFAIDARSLAAVRIGLGTILLYDSLTNLSNPGAEALGSYSSILTLPFACALLVGFKTRLATVLCWLIYGLPIRQGLVEPGVGVFLGKYVLVVFLFWAMFLPLGARLSVDARSNSQRVGPFLSVASASALIQLFFIYFFAGLNKDFGEWVFDASAMKAVLATSGFGNELGQSVAQAGIAMAVLSVATIALEILGSILLFVPGKNLSRRRVLLMGGFIAFHIGMAIFMNLGIFPFVMITVWLLFLPSTVWDKLTGAPSRHEQFATDRSVLRNMAAAAALVYISVSNYITWAFFPADSGFAAQWQQIGIFLLLYQQWAMFSIPSSLG